MSELHVQATFFRCEGCGLPCFPIHFNGGVPSRSTCCGTPIQRCINEWVKEEDLPVFIVREKFSESK